MKYETFWVVIPFPSRESAESAACEVDEIGYRHAVVKADAKMIALYVPAPCRHGETWGSR